MEKEEFEIEKILRVNIIEDSKQMRVTIPKEIVEDFGIDSKRNDFGWLIEKDKHSNKIIITGRFLIKNQDVTEEN